MLKKRFISLYYSSISFPEIFVLLKGLILYLFFKKRELFFKVNNISKFFKKKKIYTFSSARGALSACLDFANIGPGDEVILSSFTCLAVPTAVVNLGAKPIYVDINLKSTNNDVNEITRFINPRVKAIVLQHTFGNSADIQNLVRILKNKKIIIIEDCALSIGTKIGNKILGNFGHASIFSMELSKTISTGWGGILVLNSDLFFRKSDEKFKNYHEHTIFKTIKDVFQTIVSSVSNMPKFYFLGKYITYLLFKINFFRYSTPLNEVDGLTSMHFISKLSFPFVYLADYQWRRMDIISNKCHKNYLTIYKKLKINGYYILNEIDTKKSSKPISSRIALLVRDRDLIIKFFLKRGVELGRWFDGPLTPIPNSKKFNYNKKSYKNSSIISKHVVNIPCHFRLSSDDVKLICNLIEKFSLKNPNQNSVLN